MQTPQDKLLDGYILFIYVPDIELSDIRKVSYFNLNFELNRKLKLCFRRAQPVLPRIEHKTTIKQ